MFSSSVLFSYQMINMNRHINKLTPFGYLAYSNQLSSYLPCSPTKNTSNDKCGKKFVHEGSLREHFTMTHTVKRKFTHEQCSLSFKTTRCSKNHMRTHTGESNHTCPECGKRFVLAANMQIHRRLHLGISRIFSLNIVYDSSIHILTKCQYLFHR